MEKSGEIYDTYHAAHDWSDTALTNPKTDLLGIIQLSGTRPRFNDRELSHLGVESGEAPGNTVGSRMEQTMEHSGERDGATPGSTAGSRMEQTMEHSGERGGEAPRDTAGSKVELPRRAQWGAGWGLLPTQREAGVRAAFPRSFLPCRSTQSSFLRSSQRRS